MIGETKTTTLGSQMSFFDKMSEAEKALAIVIGIVIAGGAAFVIFFGSMIFAPIILGILGIE